MDNHEATRQIEYIHRLLAQNKKPIGFFIGAGGPLSIKVEKEIDGEIHTEPLLPGILDLTETIKNRFSQDSSLSDNWAKLIQLFCEDEVAQPTIEDVLTRVRALKAVAGKGEVRGFNYSELEQLDNKICSIISELINKELPSGQSWACPVFCVIGIPIVPQFQAVACAL